MEELVALALFYSYAVNGKRELADYTISAFVSDVKGNLAKLRSKYDIDAGNSSEFFNSIPCTINVRKDDGNPQPWNPNDKEVDPRKRIYANQPTLYYSFSTIDRDFVRWIDWMDRDLVCATLGEEALKCLNIKREDLPIKTNETFRSGEITMSSLFENDAWESAYDCLDSYGYTNINLGRGMVVQRGDKGYQFCFGANFVMSSLDIYDNTLFEKMANLKTILDMEAYKKEVLSKADENGKISLDNVFLAQTAWLDKDNNALSHAYRAVLKLTGDEEAFYNRMVESMPFGSSDVTVFIDLLSDAIMNFIWQGKFGNKDYERVVEDITLLADSMNRESATLEEIDKHIDELNEKQTMKELKPDNGNK